MHLRCGYCVTMRVIVSGVSKGIGIRICTFIFSISYPFLFSVLLLCISCADTLPLAISFRILGN